MRIKRLTLQCGLLLCFALLIACQSHTGPVMLDQELQVMGQVDAKGASVCSQKGVCLQFPANAVDKMITIRGKIVASSDDVVGYIYEFQADVEQFQLPIKITLPVAVGEEQTELEVAFYKDGVWTPVPTEAGADGKSRIGTTDHLSRWGVFRRKCRPKPEVCDGIDNDCDGLTDEGTTCKNGQQCKKGKCEPMCGCKSNADCSAGNLCVNCQCRPLCSPGRTSCGGGVCLNLLRNPANCGRCGHVCARTESCLNGQCTPINQCGGVQCPQGQTCQNGQCTPACTPTVETCDGLDNDCDGMADEGNLCPQGQTCQNGQCASNNQCGGVQCPQGQTCQNGQCAPNNQCGGVQCPQGQTCQNGKCTSACTPTVETCDGLDNDCDGMADEGNLCPQGQTCQNGQCTSNNQCGGVQCPQGQTCQNGKCTPACTPTVETCDGLDNDCDGMADEGNLCPQGQTCQNGQCATTSQCPGGKVACQGACVDVTSHNGHCGGCGNVCIQNKQCVAGTCLLSCLNNSNCGAGQTCQSGYCR